MSGSFLASEHGICGCCGEHIYPNDEVSWTRNGMTLIEHVKDAPPPEVCQNCFVVKSVNGECNCS